MPETMGGFSLFFSFFKGSRPAPTTTVGAPGLGYIPAAKQPAEK